MLLFYKYFTTYKFGYFIETPFDIYIHVYISKYSTIKFLKVSRRIYRDAKCSSNILTGAQERSSRHGKAMRHVSLIRLSHFLQELHRADALFVLRVPDHYHAVQLLPDLNDDLKPQNCLFIAFFISHTHDILSHKFGGGDDVTVYARFVYTCWWSMDSRVQKFFHHISETWYLLS